MNLETIIDERIWKNIRSNFESRNYSGAILDVIHFLGELIREKTDLNSDGIALIGQAFGGKNPKIKVNPLQSESDWNIQKGIEQILRGIYQAIRNPRSHEKYEDSESESCAIIIFLDYLVKIIDQSKVQFSETEFINRVFDSDFVETEHYADLLISEIPPKKKLDVLILVYKNKETGEGRKLKYFIKVLLNRLKEDELKQFLNIVSEELKVTDDKKTIRSVLQIIPSKNWIYIEESARLRIENKLIKQIRDGRYIVATKKCVSGALGTWITDITCNLTLKKELLFVLKQKLRSDNKSEQDYVFEYCFNCFRILETKPGDELIQIINNGLHQGDKRFYDALDLPIFIKNDWDKSFEKELNEFEETEQPEAVDPFLSELDDDEIPF